MGRGLYLPLDEVLGGRLGVDVATDFLEVAALLGTNRIVHTSEIVNEASIGADEESSIRTDERTEVLHCDVVERIEYRCRMLKSTYPFQLDVDGDILRFEPVGNCLGRATYVLSLVLSILQTPILDGSPLKPDEAEIRDLRRLFQYISTAALAVEIQGHSWSFGYPRPDHSPFLDKLKQVWMTLQDGTVGHTSRALMHVKDDKIDIFAARTHPDGKAGFLLAAAQVATGKNWVEKSIVGHLRAFKNSWFTEHPVTTFIPYMIVPFSIRDSDFDRIVASCGNVMHRLRVPYRVSEAQVLVDRGVTIEAYDKLSELLAWTQKFRERARVAG